MSKQLLQQARDFLGDDFYPCFDEVQINAIALYMANFAEIIEKVTWHAARECALDEVGDTSEEFKYQSIEEWREKR